MSPLASRYAKALFRVASEKQAVDAVAADLAALEKVLREPEVRARALDPDSRREVREETLGKLVEDAHEVTRDLVRVLVRRRRETILPLLHAAFHEMVLDVRGEIEGVVESARPLAAEELRKLEETASRLHGKKVRLTAREDAELIGGVRVRVGTTLYDGSVATALEELQRALLDAPLG